MTFTLKFYPLFFPIYPSFYKCLFRVNRSVSSTKLKNRIRDHRKFPAIIPCFFSHCLKFLMEERHPVVHMRNKSFLLHCPQKRLTQIRCHHLTDNIPVRTRVKQTVCEGRFLWLCYQIADVKRKKMFSSRPIPP